MSVPLVQMRQRAEIIAELFLFTPNWLQVLDTAERSQVDQRIRHQLHPIVSLLDAFKAEEQSFKFVLPGKGAFHAQA